MLATTIISSVDLQTFHCRQPSIKDDRSNKMLGCVGNFTNAGHKTLIFCRNLENCQHALMQYYYGVNFTYLLGQQTENKLMPMISLVMQPVAFFLRNHLHKQENINQKIIALTQQVLQSQPSLNLVNLKMNAENLAIEPAPLHFRDLIAESKSAPKYFDLRVLQQPKTLEIFAQQLSRQNEGREVANKSTIFQQQHNDHTHYFLQRINALLQSPTFTNNIFNARFSVKDTNNIYPFKMHFSTLQKKNTIEARMVNLQAGVMSTSSNQPQAFNKVVLPINEVNAVKVLNSGYEKPNFIYKNSTQDTLVENNLEKIVTVVQEKITKTTALNQTMQAAAEPITINKKNKRNLAALNTFTSNELNALASNVQNLIEKKLRQDIERRGLLSC